MSNSVDVMPEMLPMVASGQNFKVKAVQRCSSPRSATFVFGILAVGVASLIETSGFMASAAHANAHMPSMVDRL